MTRISKPLAARSLDEHNQRLVEIRAAGEALWQEAAAIFWDVYDCKKWKAGGFDTFEEWAQSQGYQKTQAHALKDAGQRFGNSSGAPESLRQATAQIQEERKEKRLRDMSAAEALDDSGKQRDQAAAVARQINEDEQIRIIGRAINKALNAGQRHGGMPEDFFTDFERWKGYCDQQRRLAA